MNAISRSFTGRKRIRRSFGRIPEVAPMPNLIDVQRASYEGFLQMNVRPDSRLHAGLQEVFKGVFPIGDFAGRGRLEFVYYELEKPKYDVEECIHVATWAPRVRHPSNSSRPRPAMGQSGTPPLNTSCNPACSRLSGLTFESAGTPRKRRAARGWVRHRRHLGDAPEVATDPLAPGKQPADCVHEVLCLPANTLVCGHEQKPAARVTAAGNTRGGEST